MQVEEPEPEDDIRLYLEASPSHKDAPKGSESADSDSEILDESKTVTWEDVPVPPSPPPLSPPKEILESELFPLPRSKRQPSKRTRRQTNQNSNMSPPVSRKNKESRRPVKSNGKNKEPPIIQSSSTKTDEMGTPRRSAIDRLNFRRSLISEQTLYDAGGTMGNEKHVRRIVETCVVDVPKVPWSKLAGLRQVKRHIEEMVIWPLLNPGLFKGLLHPGRGLLLFGPPGTGKTMIGKCIATEVQATFFNVDASTFASKWYGDSEGLATALFQVARARAPSIIFIDEVDAFLSTRQDNDGGCTTRLKNALLQELDGTKTSDEDKVLVIGATNRPHCIDDAARRRFTRRIYVPLPDEEDRKDLLRVMLSGEKHEISHGQFQNLARLTEGFSASDLCVACGGGARRRIRELKTQLAVTSTKKEDLRAITFNDMQWAIQNTPKSVSPEGLHDLELFNENFGSKIIE